MINNKYFKNEVSRIKFVNLRTQIKCWVPDFIEGEWLRAEDNTCKLQYTGTVNTPIPTTIETSDWYTSFLAKGYDDPTDKDPLHPLMLWLSSIDLLSFVTTEQIFDTGSSTVTSLELGTIIDQLSTNIAILWRDWREAVKYGETTANNPISWFVNLKYENPDLYLSYIESMEEGFDISVFGKVMYSLKKVAYIIGLGKLFSNIVNADLCTQTIGWWNEFVREVNEAQNIVNTTIDPDTGELKYKGFVMNDWYATYGGITKIISTTEWIDNLISGERRRGRFWQSNQGNSVINRIINQWTINYGGYTLIPA